MIGRAALFCLAMLCLASLSPAEGEAKVLGEGYRVDDRPVTVVASASAYRPSRLALDVVADPAVPVKTEWFVLCFRSPGPTTGDEVVSERPLHRRIALPPRPRGVCHFEVESRFTDPDQRGSIEVTLRGHVAKSPLER